MSLGPKNCPINDSLVSFVLVMLNNELFPQIFSNHSSGSLRSLFSLPWPFRVSVESTQSLVHNIIILSFSYFLDVEKCCRNYVDPGIEGAKIASNVSTGQKWARLKKEYLHSEWTSDTKIWMVGEQWGDLSARQNILVYFNFWLS